MRLTKRDIMLNGESLGNWPCDIGPDGTTESNGSVEHLMYCAGSYYLVYTGYFNGRIYRTRKLDDREILRAIVEDSLVGRLILQHQRARA